jgi:predicted MFS family arabinose efflux permease
MAMAPESVTASQSRDGAQALTAAPPAAVPPGAALARRLRPVYVAAFLQNLVLWVSIEKLFMSEIGFDNGSVAVMAAAYAAVVPFLEVPSGILADRWSRRGVILLAQSALLVSTLIGGLSTNVGVYVVAALFLGVFFAMQSGTFESIAYDTVLEETGDSDLFERTIGRIRFVESAALVISALLGGVLAEVVPLRATYLMTAPLIVLAAVALLGFREPQLHRAEAGVPLRQQIGCTYRTLLKGGALRPIVALMVLTALLLQVMLEFGPLWLVDLEAPAGLYGPHWAGLMAALGLGGLLGGRLALTRPATAAVIGAAIVAGGVALTTSHVVGIVIVAQVVVVLLAVAVSIPITARLHDAVSSTIRAGVASGVGTLTWMTFLPFALLFGAVSNRAGVHDAGWTLIAVAALTVLLLVWAVRGFVRSPVTVPLEPAFPAERFLPADDPAWPGHWVDPPQAWDRPGLEVGSQAVLAEVGAAVVDLPAVHHDVIVARDVERRSGAEVAEALGLDLSDELDLLHQARGRIRTRLDRYLEAAGE